MIELIMVIVILGILAAVAVPKYVNMKSEAEQASADRVFATVGGATGINLAKGMLSKPGYVAVTDGASLMAALDGTPEGWIVGTSNPNQICYDKNLDGDCTAADAYRLTVTAAESLASPANKAQIGKSW